MKRTPMWEWIFWIPLRIGEAAWAVLDHLRLKVMGKCFTVALWIEGQRAKRNRRETLRLRRERLSELRRPDLAVIRGLTDEQLEILLDLVGDDPLAEPLWREQRRRSDG